MAINGIGRLVSQYVHDRNAARAASRTAAPPDDTTGTVSPAPAPATDTAQFSADALARFAAWKARQEGTTDVTVSPAPVAVTPLPVTEVTVTD